MVEEQLSCPDAKGALYLQKISQQKKKFVTTGSYIPLLTQLGQEEKQEYSLRNK